jgi:amidohydrolase
MERTKLKTLIADAIDDECEAIVDLGRDFGKSPELGYQELKSSARVREALEALGLQCQSGIAVTGVRAEIRGTRPGPTVAVLGELDALVCRGHPDADPQTGTAHTCGHNAQVAAMWGVALGLVRSHAMSDLAGRVVFLAVPAEEYVELETRQALRRKGLVEFLGGKQEFVKLGVFDDVDMAMMVHSMPESPDRRFFVGASCNGFRAKDIRFQGVASHAGGQPEKGTNALNAATLAIMGIHAQRETFRDEDAIRVHFIVTHGGDLVNIVPDDVRMELFVRGRSLDAIRDASAKVDRALEGAAAMVGAQVLIDDLPGYLPLEQSTAMTDLFRENAAILVGKENVVQVGHLAASTDMGDLSHIMPVLHPFCGGYEGRNHHESFRIVDETMAYVIPAKALAMTVVDLLGDGAVAGRMIVETHSPALTRPAYLAHLRGKKGDS